MHSVRTGKRKKGRTKEKKRKDQKKKRKKGGRAESEPRSHSAAGVSRDRVDRLSRSGALSDKAPIKAPPARATWRKSLKLTATRSGMPSQLCANQAAGHNRDLSPS